MTVLLVTLIGGGIGLGLAVLATYDVEIRIKKP